MQNMGEALEWAADYATRNKLFEPITNQRGYADNWKPPSPADKAEIITNLAREVMKVDDEKYFQDMMQDLHDAAMLENVPDLTRAVNNIHASLYQHLKRR